MLRLRGELTGAAELTAPLPPVPAFTRAPGRNAVEGRRSRLASGAASLTPSRAGGPSTLLEVYGLGAEFRRFADRLRYRVHQH